jgi:hypothetical protein
MSSGFSMFYDHLRPQLYLDFWRFQGEEWGGLYEDDLALPEPEEEPQESDSDFEFDGTRIKKTKSKKFAKAKTTKLSAPTAKASRVPCEAFLQHCAADLRLYSKKNTGY